MNINFAKLNLSYSYAFYPFIHLSPQIHYPWISCQLLLIKLFLSTVQVKISAHDVKKCKTFNSWFVLYIPQFPCKCAQQIFSIILGVRKHLPLDGG